MFYVHKHSRMSRGFGFVEMPKAGAAKAAIKALNNTVVDDAKIRVKLAQAKSPEPSYAGVNVGIFPP